jgi:hypothetical protein
MIKVGRSIPAIDMTNPYPAYILKLIILRMTSEPQVIQKAPKARR